jgi:hypothetical protein
MQIHEITTTKLDEGVGSFLGNVAGKVAAGAKNLGQKMSATGDFKNAYGNQMRTQQTGMLAKKVTQIWLNYTQQLKTATPDPARYDILYPQTLTAFVQKNLLGGQSINTATNKQEINQLINQISAAKDNPKQVAQLMSTLVQQSTLSQQDVTGGSTLTKVISTDPAVIEYRGATFAVNDTGEWSNQKTGKVLDQSFQAFFDQELIKAGGSAPAPGTAPGTTAPEPRRVSRTRGRE